MGHKDHEEFTKSVFRQLCEDASKTLPAFDPSAAWEEKAETVLNHLKDKVVNFCGVREGFNFEDVTGFPRFAQLVSEIVSIVDFDMVHEHGPFIKFFHKAPIVMQYVIDTVGERDSVTAK